MSEFPTKTHATQEEPPKSQLTVNQSALAYAILHNKNSSIVEYTIDPKDGSRIVPTVTSREWPDVVATFKKDPKEAIATLRLNVLAVAKDMQLPESERKARVERYTKAFLELQILLDREAFPKSDTPVQGIPSYIPDGLVDMGSDPNLDPATRSREMIHVDKVGVFKHMLPAFERFFLKGDENSSSNESKIDTIKKVAAFVYTSMPYDREEIGPYAKSKESVTLDSVLKGKLALCRHHALYTQVVLQAFGITSRLLKCDFDLGNGRKTSHCANLARVNGQWYLLDATNPDAKDGVGEISLVPIPSDTVGPEGWSVSRKDGREWKYYPRNNMHYFIK